MFYYLLAILGLSVIFWLLYKYKISPVCPVCAAVVITWAGGLVALYLGLAWQNALVVGILMGASMGALAERYGSKFGLLWKTSTVLLGFGSIYFLITGEPYRGLSFAATIVVITSAAYYQRTLTSQGRRDWFKDCC